jgi:gluconokinase
MGPTAVVVMGVSGSGKSTVGSALAEHFGWPYLEGDSLHPPSNVAKMAAGQPLDDADRAPWLAHIRDWMAKALGAGGSCVVACSALKRAYRDVLRDATTGIDGASVRFAYLEVDAETLYRRLSRRQHHYMHADMLASQLGTLEPPDPDERAITIRLSDRTSPSGAVAEIITELALEA